MIGNLIGELLGEYCEIGWGIIGELSENYLNNLKNMLEKPLFDTENWIRELTGIEIYIFNKSTVQAVDL